VFQRLVGAIWRRSVAHQDVETAEGLFNVVDQPRHFVAMANVGRKHAGTAAFAAFFAAVFNDEPHGITGAILVDIGNHDCRSVLRKVARNGAPAPAATGTRDDRDLSGEVRHFCLVYTCPSIFRLPFATENIMCRSLWPFFTSIRT
jgi:hypothetical protein